MTKLKINDFIKKNYISIFVVLIIIIQTISVIYVANRKEEYHIDEIYSYILSNSHNADRLTNTDLLWERWVESSDWNEFTTVQKGERFDYATVYSNNTKDCHPPLFYWCLNTVCSLFPDSFSKWYGIALNIVFFVLSLTIIYIISKKIIQNEYLSFLPMIIWGFSPVAFDTTIFIRMYSLLTLNTLLFSLIVLKLFQDGHSKRLLIFLFVVTLLGELTHYYFVVIAFCISAAYCIYCFVKKKYREMFVYGLTEVSAIALLFILYPAAISQITGSSTNNVGNEISATVFTFSGWQSTITEYIFQCIDSCGKGLLTVKSATDVVLWGQLFFLFIAAPKIKYSEETLDERKKQSQKCFRLFYVCFLIVFLYIIIISKLSYTFVYTRYLYHVIPLIIITKILLIEFICYHIKISLKGVFGIILILSVINARVTIRSSGSEYLYESQGSYYNSLYEKYGDIPVVLLSERKTYVLTGNYTFLRNYSNVYVTPEANINNMDNILSTQNCTSGILLLVWSDKVWADGYDKDKVISDVEENCTLFDSYQYIGQLNFCDLYYLN